MTYVLPAVFLFVILWLLDPMLGMLAFWALLGAGIGVSASQRRGYPLPRFAGIGAMLGLFALVLYLAPRREEWSGRILISDEALASVQQALRDQHALEADRLREKLRRPRTA